MPTYTDNELDQIERETMARIQQEPRLESASYEPESGDMMFTMYGGAKIVVAARTLKGLAGATDAELADVHPREMGTSVHWDTLDVQYDTIAMLERIFKVRTHRTVSSAGGQAKSEVKAATSKANGAKGGRPKKKAGGAGVTATAK